MSNSQNSTIIDNAGSINNLQTIVKKIDMNNMIVIDEGCIYFQFQFLDKQVETYKTEKICTMKELNTFLQINNFEKSQVGSGILNRFFGPRDRSERVEELGKKINNLGEEKNKQKSKALLEKVDIINKLRVKLIQEINNLGSSKEKTFLGKCNYEYIFFDTKDNEKSKIVCSVENNPPDVFFREQADIILKKYNLVHSPTQIIQIFKEYNVKNIYRDGIIFIMLDNLNIARKKNTGGAKKTSRKKV